MSTRREFFAKALGLAATAAPIGSRNRLDDLFGPISETHRLDVRLHTTITEADVALTVPWAEWFGRQDWR